MEITGQVMSVKKLENGYVLNIGINVFSDIEFCINDIIKITKCSIYTNKKGYISVKYDEIYKVGQYELVMS